MKTKIILFSIGLFLITGISFAQNKNEPKSIISEKVAIKKYHTKEELERMQKGELLFLYMERIEVLIKTLPYIAFATKPGVTMTTLGIPNDSDNRKILDNQFEATDDYYEATTEFHKKILPYSDTSKLISAIIFYEEIMKSLHEYSAYH
ncbi:hypothetical protein EV196_110132 [Mariniflexile fucanivorans]|uniref:Uncharacterized protein n=1 Tax=Mariniflexile fucanivorans TaxID=264023 RepID=A0A4R1RBU2_9FLAO|nr:hypothetical protein [Mariniflexile fucanivorans]TCL63179.1 hypothetical protein EV196_110132 [Mariniflexile fucanivorans]